MFLDTKEEVACLLRYHTMFAVVRRVLCSVKPGSKVLGKYISPVVYQCSTTYVTESDVINQKISHQHACMDNQHEIPSTADRLIENG